MGLIWWKHKWCRLMLHLQKCHLHHHSSQGTSRAHRKRPWISVTTTNLPFARCQKLAQHQLLPHHQWRHLQRGRRLQHGRHLSVPLPGNPKTSRKKNYTFGCAEDNVEEETEERCKNHRERQEIQGTQCDEKNNCQSCICPHSKKATQRKERNRRRCQTRRHHNDRNTVEAIVSLARTNGQSFFHWLLWCSKETSPCATLDGVFWGWHTRVRIESSSISGARTSFHASHEPMWLEPHSSDMLYQQQWQGYALV